MKRYIFCLVLLVLLTVCVDPRRAEAYSVSVEDDGIYAKTVPSSIMKNVPAIFKKQVRKSMKYYDKYKDAGYYTYATSVPDEYRDFIPVARQIRDSDDIVIKNPFYIYQAGDDTAPCEYNFFVEKNGKILCKFSIYVDPEDGKIDFRYDKIWDGHFTYVDETMDDSHFKYDDKTVGETLFYEIDDILYAETPDKISVVSDRRLPEGSQGEMISVGGAIDWKARQEALDKEFMEKSYREKKDEILGYMEKSKDGKLIKKAESNLKLELKDEYVGPEKVAEENGRTGNFIAIGIYIVIGMAVLVIGVLISEILIKIKRKKE